MMYHFTPDKREKGITLLIATIVAGTLLLVVTAIINIVVKEQYLAGAGEDSQHAFYAADSGMECALYWDVKNPDPTSPDPQIQKTRGYSAFATTSPAQNIYCDGHTYQVGGTGMATTTFSETLDPYCADITVVKNTDGSTVIESRGYNTCVANNPRRVERAVRIVHN